MLDIKFIKNNINEVKENIKKRHVSANADLVVELYDRKNELQIQADSLRQKRNENAKKMKAKMEQDQRNILIQEGKELKEEISGIENEIFKINEQFLTEIANIPNMTHPTTPEGETEEESTILKEAGEKPDFGFNPKDHLELALDLDIIDFEKAAKVTGQKFYYLKNEGAVLEFALIQFVLKLLLEKGFSPYITPDLARESVVRGIGFNPRGDETNIYSIDNSDLCLIATAEITLGGMYSDEIIPLEKLPIKMLGFSHCFRTEAGAAGRAQKGLYRVHQFSKVEMFVITKENEADDMLEKLRSIEEEIFNKLEIPYRVLDIASGDLGNPAYKKYDIEAWMPGRNEYGEVTSTSNCTDYQARRLNIKYKGEDGKNKYVYMLNGTAMAVPRVIIAIIENFQQEDGTIVIPDALVPYTGFKKIQKK